MQLGVELGELVGFVHAGIVDIPDSGGFHYVTDNELLDRLILRDASRAVGATDGINMAAAMLGTSSVPTFRRL